MQRLTKKETAAELKENAEKLRAIGLEPSIMDLRYMKLAEYEDKEEAERDYKTEWETYYFRIDFYDPHAALLLQTKDFSVLNDSGMKPEQIYIAAVKKAFELLKPHEHLLALKFKTLQKWR